jgi:hypothetical protein
MGWWLAVPVGVALGLALALALDRAAEPAAGQGGRPGFAVSGEQLRINQRISQAAVKRSNRANTRLDRLRLPAGPAGPAGAAGAAATAAPAGPGAVRIAFSAAPGAPPQTVLDAAGVTMTAACAAEAGGGAAVDVTFGVAQASTIFGTTSIASGTDRAAPATTEAQNIELPLPAGATLTEGDPAAGGAYVREFVSAVIVTPTRTLSFGGSLLADAAADRCTFNGVVVPS